MNLPVQQQLYSILQFEWMKVKPWLTSEEARVTSGASGRRAGQQVRCRELETVVLRRGRRRQGQTVKDHADRRGRDGRSRHLATSPSSPQAVSEQRASGKKSVRAAVVGWELVGVGAATVRRRTSAVGRWVAATRARGRDEWRLGFASLPGEDGITWGLGLGFTGPCSLDWLRWAGRLG
jgi:hypothetical protein